MVNTIFDIVKFAWGCFLILLAGCGIISVTIIFLKWLWHEFAGGF
jgi:hypothetical protein